MKLRGRGAFAVRGSFARAVAPFALSSPVDFARTMRCVANVFGVSRVSPCPAVSRKPTAVIVGLPEEVLNSPMGGMLRPLLEQMTTQVVVCAFQSCQAA